GIPMTKTAIRATQLPSSEKVPVLGQGTWHMGEDRDRRAAEIAALRLGLELGMSVIDTAELYGSGASEHLVAEAIEGRRDEAFLVSKVLPHHATHHGTIMACESSLRRLDTDHLDLYLLHWRGRIPLSDTVEAFEQLMQGGKIRYWGVSNFDVNDMEELFSLENGGNCASNQVLYNLAHRGIEFDLLPWCRERKISIMAYSPIEQGLLVENSQLRKLAKRHNATPAQIALAWVLREEGIIAIPKAGTPEHVRENRETLNIQLTRKDLDDLDEAFPPPKQKIPLEMI
ncbi:MAG TPA: aldo/keto reductase, partial [Tepidisphaeraceae bacterium]|nr:aldo/keto reductase [Tepidisphaeraceae bacterium]